METNPHQIELFRAGGTLPLNSLSYVRRPADDELFRNIMHGSFCYVLTSRQYGKSSLVVRVSKQLEENGICTAVVDLSGIGTLLTRDQWYLGIIKIIANALHVSIKPELWWREHNVLGPVQCFIDFLHDVVLTETTNQVAIFIDEIDSTLKLNFTDDFFAAIRLMYNLRATNSDYERLTFVLLGVASPADLIKDRMRTPFNIGHSIELTEFTKEDTKPLRDCLECVYPGQAKSILDRIFYWTCGHPYLTQKLCLAVVESKVQIIDIEYIDKLVENIFFNEDKGKEENLNFVRSSIEGHSKRRQLLQLYSRIYHGHLIIENERDVLQSRLQLIGLIRSRQKTLCIHNPIYRHVFNQTWVKSNTPLNWSRIVTISTIIISIIAIISTILLFWYQKQQVASVKADTYIREYRNTTDSSVRMNYLAGLCNIEHVEEARQLFFEQTPEYQLMMFQNTNIGRDVKDLEIVFDCVYPSIPDHIKDPIFRTELSHTMCLSLCQRNNVDTKQSQVKSDQICNCK